LLFSPHYSKIVVGVKDNPVRLNPARFSAVSGQLSGLCSEAPETTFSSQHELSKILSAKQPADLLLKEESSATYANAAHCADTTSGNIRNQFIIQEF
jgi:hypothetical protein